MNTLEAIKEELEQFPEEFGLAAFKGKRFRADPIDSFYPNPPSEDGARGELQIYTHIFDEERGEWLAFTRGTASEIYKELVVLEGFELPIPVEVKSNGRIDMFSYCDWATGDRFHG